MDALTLSLQHSRDGVLGEPVDLQIWLQPAQPSSYRDVAPCVAQADRGGHEEGARAAVRAIGRGVTRSSLECEGILRELPERQVALHRLTQVGEVPGAVDHLKPPAAETSQRSAISWRGDLVLAAVDHQRRAVKTLRQSTESASATL